MQRGNAIITGYYMAEVCLYVILKLDSHVGPRARPYYNLFITFSQIQSLLCRLDSEAEKLT